MSERPTYYAWVTTDGEILLHDVHYERNEVVDESGQTFGYLVPVQVADLSKGERVVSAEFYKAAMDALNLQAIRAGSFARITEGRE